LIFRTWQKEFLYVRWLIVIRALYRSTPSRLRDFKACTEGQMTSWKKDQCRFRQTPYTFLNIMVFNTEAIAIITITPQNNTNQSPYRE
jgi:hypothetical protein